MARALRIYYAAKVNMKAGILCNPKVFCAHRDESIVTAARRMREHHVGSLIVVDGDDAHQVPSGMLTDRDIVVGVIAHDHELLPRLLVGDIMSKKPIVATADEEVSDVLKTMRRNAIRRVPVVDASGLLLGILSLDDVMDHLANQLRTMAETVTWQPQRERQSRP